MILIVCDPADKLNLRIKVVGYGEAIAGDKPDNIIVVKPDERYLNKELVKAYIRERLKPKLAKDKDIIYV